MLPSAEPIGKVPSTYRAFSARQNHFRRFRQILFPNSAAWDFIPTQEALTALAGRADAVCFGSLGQRSAVSRATIQGFTCVGHAPARSLAIRTSSSFPPLK